MKPHVICHMVTSVDGRVHGSRWRPQANRDKDLFERLHEELGGDAWLVGRVTGQEFAKRQEPYPATSGAALPRTPWFATRSARAWGIVLDAQGKIAWGRSDIGGDPIVVLLTESVADSHLAGLRSEGISYVFAGRDQLDLRLALDLLNRELGIARLLLEGGGKANGAFLRAGLVDELSLAIQPVVDGAQGAPIFLDSTPKETAARAPLASMRLVSCQTLAGGSVWLRYALGNA